MQSTPSNMGKSWRVTFEANAGQNMSVHDAQIVIETSKMRSWFSYYAVGMVFVPNPVGPSLPYKSRILKVIYGSKMGGYSFLTHLGGTVCPLRERLWIKPHPQRSPEEVTNIPSC